MCLKVPSGWAHSPHARLAGVVNAFPISAMASAGALFHLMGLPNRDEAITRSFAIAGQAAELAAMFVIGREVSSVDRVADPLDDRAFYGRPLVRWALQVFCSPCFRKNHGVPD